MKQTKLVLMKKAFLVFFLLIVSRISFCQIEKYFIPALKKYCIVDADKGYFNWVGQKKDTLFVSNVDLHHQLCFVRTLKASKYVCKLRLWAMPPNGRGGEMIDKNGKYKMQYIGAVK